MNIITVINAKGGCGKSTIAMSVAAGLAREGHATLLIDMDPQAQVTQWLGLGDGLSSQGTLVAAMEGQAAMDALIQPTAFPNLSFIASSQSLEDVGRQITEREGYQAILTTLLAPLSHAFEFVVIDSPNQISPVMENCIYPSDAFIRLLAQRLGVNLRRSWCPDEAWLASYQKIQLADLIGKLRGPAHGSAAEQRKKSELVAELTKLFADAAAGRLDDPDLAARVNGWLPVNLRPETAEAPAKK